MAVIDVHTHIYPAKISDKAARAVGTFYNLETFAGSEEHFSGTSKQLISVVEAGPITHHVVHSVATTPGQVESIDDFILEECKIHQRFIGFGCMHQDYQNPEKELKRIKALGLRGIKIHPDIQRVNLDDPRLMTTYEICQELGLAIIFHTGDYRFDYSHPRRLVNVLHAFPNLKVDAAHMGGWSIVEIGYDYLKSENCFVDISSTFAFSGIRRARELVNLYGSDRVLFGSDFPLGNPLKEYETFMKMGLGDEANEKILWHNAERFLDLIIN